MGIVLLLSMVAACVDVADLDDHAHVALRFDTNVAVPVADDVAVIDAIAADVAGTEGPICVLGATDEVGGDDDNFALGGARAAHVIEALVARGVDRSRFSWQSVGEHRLGRSVVVVFDRPVPVPLPVEVDVLDLPTVPADVVDDEAPATPRRRPPMKKKPSAPSPTRAFIDGLEPEWRRPAGMLVVATGAACGAGVGLGLCCVAPFTAPIGVTVAASAVDQAAELDAMSGAGVGALVGGIAGVVVAGSFIATLSERSINGATAVATVAAIPAGGVVGAGVGAAIGWWNSPSDRALAVP